MMMKRLLFVLLCLSFGAVGQQKIYTSDRLNITSLSENTFVHTSFLQTDDFGKVACNGLIVRSGHEVAVFDTPTDDPSSQELIRWVQDMLKCRIVAIVPTHFHSDCLGGLSAFHVAGISSMANEKTIELATQHQMTVPQKGFSGKSSLLVGGNEVQLRFFGEGHTRDNVVAYFPSEQILFGGCLIKEIGASKGFLGDANVGAWSATVEKIQSAYPDVKHVVPGHGAVGDTKLLEYTRQLFLKP
ncbi:subclass B1 metallo-beta-lactamase [Aquirufa sp. TARAVU-A1A]